jgi:hypothetical protein
MVLSAWSVRTPHGSRLAETASLKVGSTGAVSYRRVWTATLLWTWLSVGVRVYIEDG